MIRLMRTGFWQFAFSITIIILSAACQDLEAVEILTEGQKQLLLVDGGLPPSGDFDSGLSQGVESMSQELATSLSQENQEDLEKKFVKMYKKIINFPEFGGTGFIMHIHPV